MARDVYPARVTGMDLAMVAWRHLGTLTAARAAGTDQARVTWRHLGTLTAASAAGRLLGAIMFARGNPEIILLYVTLLLVILPNDTELNPGPQTPKYPCQICDKAVTWKQKPHIQRLSSVVSRRVHAHFHTRIPVKYQTFLKAYSTQPSSPATTASQQ